MDSGHWFGRSSRLKARPCQAPPDHLPCFASPPAVKLQPASVAFRSCGAQSLTDAMDGIRHQRLIDINAKPGSRTALEAKHGRVWETSELAADFDVLGFLAPYVAVRRKSDGRKGSLEFQHNPRFYFDFVPDEG